MISLFFIYDSDASLTLKIRGNEGSTRRAKNLYTQICVFYLLIYKIRSNYKKIIIIYKSIVVTPLAFTFHMHKTSN